MGFDRQLAEGKPESGRVVSLRAPSLDRRELLEDLVAHIRRHARALIMDGDTNAAFAAGDGDTQTACGRCVRDTVGDEVLHDSADEGAVTAHGHRARTLDVDVSVAVQRPQ